MGIKQYQYLVTLAGVGIRRPLDLLRVHHEKIKGWILEQGGDSI